MMKGATETDGATTKIKREGERGRISTLVLYELLIQL